ncbi:endonuclease/exonuclease/phosphatase family protein [Vibrio astriarenae]
MKHWISPLFVILIGWLPSPHILATDSIFPLKVVTWNIEWLSSEHDKAIPESIRTNDDYTILKRYFKILSPDVLAFQEVNDIDAIRRVVGSSYHIVLSDRAKEKYQHHQFPDINQYTGFAIKHRLAYDNYEDFPLVSKRNSKLRFASYIVLAPDSSQPVHMLSVHLKAGCSGAQRENYACHQLEQQAQALGEWIAEREAQNQAYVIAGDFNHKLDYPTDWVWESIRVHGDMHLATKNTPTDCKVRSNKSSYKTHQFRSLIDHIIVSNDLSSSKVRQSVYSVRDVLDHRLSDHCPITATLASKSP